MRDICFRDEQDVRRDDIEHGPEEANDPMCLRQMDTGGPISFHRYAMASKRMS